MGGEADVTPYLLSRYFGLRSFTTLYGLTWTLYAFAWAIGPVIMGKAFDATGSYEALLVTLAIGTFSVGADAADPTGRVAIGSAIGPGDPGRQRRQMSVWWILSRTSRAP